MHRPLESDRREPSFSTTRDLSQAPCACWMCHRCGFDEHPTEKHHRFPMNLKERYCSSPRHYGREDDEYT